MIKVKGSQNRQKLRREQNRIQEGMIKYRGKVKEKHNREKF